MTFIVTDRGYINLAHVVQIREDEDDHDRSILSLADGSTVGAGNCYSIVDAPLYFVPAEPGAFALVTHYDAERGFSYRRERVIAWGITDDWTWPYTVSGKADDGVATLFPDGKVEWNGGAWDSLEAWALSAAGDARDRWKAPHREGLARQEWEARQRRDARGAGGGGTGSGFAVLSQMLNRQRG